MMLSYIFSGRGCSTWPQTFPCFVRGETRGVCILNVRRRWWTLLSIDPRARRGLNGIVCEKCLLHGTREACSDSTKSLNSPHGLHKEHCTRWSGHPHDAPTNCFIRSELAVVFETAPWSCRSRDDPIITPWQRQWMSTFTNSALFRSSKTP